MFSVFFKKQDVKYALNCLEFPCASYHSFRSTERCFFFAFCYRAKEIKCPYKHRAVTPETACHGDSQFHLEIKDDFPALKTTHKYYYQVQGQMGITGAKWCDFVTYTFKGMAIERIYFDDNFFSNMLLKLGQFFFKHYAKYLKSTDSQQQVVPEGACADTPSTVTVSTSASSSSSTG